MWKNDFAPKVTFADGLLALLLYLLVLVIVFEPLFVAVRKFFDRYVQDEMQKVLAREERERVEKEEAKERLRFRGKYSWLFYHIVWENFKIVKMFLC